MCRGHGPGTWRTRGNGAQWRRAGQGRAGQGGAGRGGAGGGGGGGGGEEGRDEGVHGAWGRASARLRFSSRRMRQVARRSSTSTYRVPSTEGHATEVLV